MNENPLFLALNQINMGKNPDFLDDEAIYKAYSPYMIHRFLSMDVTTIPIVNQVNQYLSVFSSKLSKMDHYRLMLNLIPKKPRFHKYIGKKGTAKHEYVIKLIEIVAHECMVTKIEAFDLTLIMNKNKTLDQYIVSHGMYDKLKIIKSNLEK